MSKRSLDELLDVLQPLDVLLLLLVVYVVRDEQSHPGVDATLLEVSLEQVLEVLIEVVKGRTSVERPPRPVLLCSRGVGEIGGGEVPHVLDDEVTVLGGGLDGKSALSGSLDANVGVSWEALLAHVIVVFVVELLTVGGSIAVLRCYAEVPVAGVALANGALGVGTAGLAVNDVVDFAVVHGRVVDVLVGHVVVQVGGREGNADLLIAKGASEGNLLVARLVLELSKSVSTLVRICSGVMYLVGAVLEVFLDVGREILIVLLFLLHGDFVLQLYDKLLLDCDMSVRPQSKRIPSRIVPSESCLRIADKWKEVVRRGADCAHAGRAATGRRRDDCGRIAFEERRAADRGAARAMLRRPSIVIEDGVYEEDRRSVRF